MQALLTMAKHRQLDPCDLAWAPVLKLHVVMKVREAAHEGSSTDDAVRCETCTMIIGHALAATSSNANNFKACEQFQIRSRRAAQKATSMHKGWPYSLLLGA